MRLLLTEDEPGLLFTVESLACYCSLSFKMRRSAKVIGGAPEDRLPRFKVLCAEGSCEEDLI